VGLVIHHPRGREGRLADFHDSGYLMLRHTAGRSAWAEDMGEHVPEPGESHGGDVPDLWEAVPEHGDHH